MNIYHQQCFRCQSCEQIFNNQEFYEYDQYVLCTSCYLRHFVVYCIKCHQVLKGFFSALIFDKKQNFKAIEANGLIYHNHPFHFSCFTCTTCKQSIGNQRYVEYKSQAYCLNCSNKKKTNSSSHCLYSRKTGMYLNKKQKSVYILHVYVQEGNNVNSIQSLNWEIILELIDEDVDGFFQD